MKKIVIENCGNCPHYNMLASAFDEEYGVCDFEDGKDVYRMLKPKEIPPDCPLEDDKTDAVEFAQWMLDNKYKVGTDNGYSWWMSEDERYDYSPIQLYKLFKQERNEK